jgi:non-lysosomal glucosylceramidase
MGKGCLTDQQVGQYAAHLAGLGYLCRPENVRRALAAVFRYNFKKTLEGHENYARTYALNDESGVVIAEFPRELPARVAVTSAPEIWSGSEYQVAAHMFYEGLMDEGLEIIRAIRIRHDGERRNPWNEPECGHHYIRALAAWSSVVVLSGFGYEARSAELEVTPRQAGLRRGFWAAASGWGNFEIDRERLRILPKWGNLQVESVRVRRSDWSSPDLPAGRDTSVTATLGGQSSPLRYHADEEWVYFRFPARLSLTRDKALEIGTGKV